MNKKRSKFGMEDHALPLRKAANCRSCSALESLVRNAIISAAFCDRLAIRAFNTSRTVSFREKADLKQGDEIFTKLSLSTKRGGMGGGWSSSNGGRTNGLRSSRLHGWNKSFIDAFWNMFWFCAVQGAMFTCRGRPFLVLGCKQEMWSPAMRLLFWFESGDASNMMHKTGSAPNELTINMRGAYHSLSLLGRLRNS